MTMDSDCDSSASTPVRFVTDPAHTQWSKEEWKMELERLKYTDLQWITVRNKYLSVKQDL